MKNTDPNYTPGTVLTYEDMANPRSSYTVIRRREWAVLGVKGTDYELRSESGERVFSDCRQAGWRVA